MTILLALYLAVTANIDNLGVGIAYGIRGIRITHAVNCIIAVEAFLITWLATTMGAFVNHLITTTLAIMSGAIILIGIGIWIMWPSLIVWQNQFHSGDLLQHPEAADMDDSQEIDFREGLILGFAVAINAFATGFDGGIIQVPPLILALLVGAFSFVTIATGLWLGKYYVTDRLGNWATFGSGLLMVLLGIHQLFSFAFQP